VHSSAETHDPVCGKAVTTSTPDLLKRHVVANFAKNTLISTSCGSLAFSRSVESRSEYARGRLIPLSCNLDPEYARATYRGGSQIRRHDFIADLGSTARSQWPQCPLIGFFRSSSRE
jgi:hypothetical protein